MEKCNNTNDMFAYADSNRPSIVYMATCETNGKRYIGITSSTLRRRMKQHIACALRGGTGSLVFYRAIRKFGPEAFRFEVISECQSFREAAQEEIRLIAKLNPEYNLSLGGETVGGIGFRLSPRSIAKMRRTKEKRPQPKYWLGKKRPDIAEKQRSRLTGRADLTKHLWTAAHAPEVIAKMRATRKAQGMTQNHIAANTARRKTIICLDDNRIFYGAQAVADELGCKKSAVSDCVLGRQKTVCGLRFEYVRGRPT